MPRRGGDGIRTFILRSVEGHPKDVAKVTSEHFGISRQAVSMHVRALVTEGLLEVEGSTSDRIYRARPITSHQARIAITPGLAEHDVYNKHVLPYLHGIEDRVIRLCDYAMEIINNAIDHSGSDGFLVAVERTQLKIKIRIIDDGVGIFNKIQKDFNLVDQRQALLELAKGKLTSDPEKHSGEGIFWTSRMCDEFTIHSGRMFFTRNYERGDWLLDDMTPRVGTAVELEIDPATRRDPKEVVDNFGSEYADLGFTKTHIPLTLARHGSERLVSRSQAKRVLSRFKDFREVMLDFRGIDTIGQAFADEIFRVFRKSNPEVKLVWVNANSEISKLIERLYYDQPSRS